MIKIYGCKERIGKSDCDIRSHASECLGTNVSEIISSETSVYMYVTTRRHTQEVNEVWCRWKVRLGKHWSTTEGQISGRKKPDGLDGRLSR